MKKLTLLSSFICMVLLSVSFVPAANAAPYTYTGDKPIYPAVYQAVISGNKSVWSQSKASFPDFNTAVIDHVRTNDGINVADFTLRISLENNVVTYRFSNVKTRLPVAKDSDFASVDKLQPKTEQSFIDYFDKEIPKIMGNEALYAKAKEAADKSIGGPPGGGALTYSLALQNPQNYLIYPAVAAAFNSLKQTLGKTSDLYDISCLDNEFVIQNCFGVRGAIDYIEYKIKIAYKEGKLNINFTDIKSGGGSSINAYESYEIDKAAKFDTQKIVDQLKAQIEKSLASADAYKSAKKAFFENNSYLYRVLNSLTSFSKDEFVEKVLKGEELSFSASVSDVKKNEVAEFKNYTAVISGSLRPEGSNLFSVPRVTLYTSDSSLTRLKSGEKVTLSGKFVRLEERTGSYYFILTK